MGLVKRGGETRRRGRRNCGRDIKTKKINAKQNKKVLAFVKQGELWRSDSVPQEGTLGIDLLSNHFPRTPDPWVLTISYPCQGTNQLSPPKHLMWPGSHLPMSRRLRNPHPYFLLLAGPLLINYSQPEISQDWWLCLDPQPILHRDRN